MLFRSTRAITEKEVRQGVREMRAECEDSGSLNTKANGGALGPLLGLKGDVGQQLGKVAHYKGVLAVKP